MVEDGFVVMCLMVRGKIVLAGLTLECATVVSSVCTCGVGRVSGVGVTVGAVIGSTCNRVLSCTLRIGVRGVVSGVGAGGIFLIGGLDTVCLILYRDIDVNT